MTGTQWECCGILPVPDFRIIIIVQLMSSCHSKIGWPRTHNSKMPIQIQTRRIKLQVIIGYLNQLSFKRLEINLSGIHPHHPAFNPNKPGKVRRVCNAASEFEEHSLNKSLLLGLDLLQNFVGIVFRFRRKPFGTSADIEAMFLQVQFPPEDAKCLRFLW